MSTRAKLVWVAALYFAEGLPYGLIFDTFNAYLATQEASLRSIGLVTAVSLPWTLKFLWAPAVDLWGERRHWFTAAQLGVAAVLLVMVVSPPGNDVGRLWPLLLVVALAGATQDIAIDAYTIELVDRDEMARANSVRQTTYRLATSVTAGGLLLWLAAAAGWPATFAAAAAVFAALAVMSATSPRVPRPEPARDTQRPFRERAQDAVVTPFRLFVTRRGLASFLGVLAFVILFRVGEYALGPMVTPFRKQRGLSLEEIGFLTGFLSPAATIAGFLVAGWVTTRLGVFRALVILGFFQAASNLGYAAAALAPAGVKWPLYAASAVESFCGGLGSTPFITFLTLICARGHAATQFALLTALFNVTGLVARTSSGFLAEWLGFAPYFAATFVISFSSYAFLPWVRRWIPAAEPPRPRPENAAAAPAVLPPQGPRAEPRPRPARG
jgi:PAT family beta-lactamase induction signal transducer AmpG